MHDLKTRGAFMAFRVYIKWKSVLKRWGCVRGDVTKRVHNNMRHSITI